MLQNNNENINQLTNRKYNRASNEEEKFNVGDKRKRCLKKEAR